MSVTPWAVGELFNRLTLNKRIEETNAEFSTAKASALKIVQGRYVGTGTYGNTNRSSLTFNIVPQIVFIWRAGAADDQEYLSAILFVDEGRGQSDSGSYPIGLFVSKSSDGNTVLWYSTQMNGQSSQMNKSGCEYIYAAIGSEVVTA